MKRTLVLMVMLVGGLVERGVLAEPPMQASETNQLKSDLIGHTMGGREKCWKFQSPDQIKELVIKNKTDNAEKRVYVIALQLQAAKASEKYAAEARVEYLKVPAGWKCHQVGLLSLKKME